MSQGGIILFDGVCVLCSRWVSFVLERDVARRFRFVAIQTPAGRALAERHGVDPDNPPTTIVIAGDTAHFRSDAALVVLRDLPLWGWTRFLRAVPGALRDWLYDRIAQNRYRIFGRRDACLVPTPDIRSRFIDRVEDLPR